MASDTAFEKEIKELFLGEAGEVLDLVEASLLAIEKNPADVEAFSALLRYMHNLKGSGRSVGFDNIAKFAHQVENLLVAVRGEKVAFTTPVVGLLLQSGDRLRKNVNTLKADNGAVLDDEDLLQQLAAALAGELTESAETSAPTEESFCSAPSPSIETKPVATIIPFDSKTAETAGATQSAASTAAVPQTPSAPTASAAPTAVKIGSADAPGQAARPRSEEFMRISMQKIEDLLNNFGEQVILQATLDHVKYDLDNHRDLALKTINQLSKLTYDLQQSTIALRMISLKQVFSKMERTARDTAIAVSKKIQFLTDGQECELDKSIVDSISDPLNHMIRNAVDHGMETEQERRDKGKDPCGKISLKGFRKGGYFYITVEDDGRGLDKDKIFQKAVKVGLIRPDAKLSEAETYDLLYANGFSTRETASDISGRGVGMNVVKESIRDLKGSITIESKLGHGTLFTIRLPLTLSIFNGMVVKISDNLYIIPNSDVETVLALPAQGSRFVSDKDRVIDVGDSVIPLVDLRDRLKTLVDSRSPSALRTHKGTLVVTHSNGIRHALLVDEIVSQQRVVQKTLGVEVSQRFKGAAGATILGDGSAALILDISALLPNAERAA